MAPFYKGFKRSNYRRRRMNRMKKSYKPNMANKVASRIPRAISNPNIAIKYFTS